MKIGRRLCMFVPLLVLVYFFLIPQNTFGQTPFAESTVVRQKCGACHKPDQQGRIDVIEATRKSPEEWKNVIERMIRINGAIVEDSEFYVAVKELSTHLCLSPKEMAAIAYINSDENSQYREEPKTDFDKRLYKACVRCHTYGKIASHRMTPSNWADIRNLHLGYYPTVIPQMREMDWAKESKEIFELLGKNFPFEDQEWQGWMKGRKDADLNGKWVVAGYEPSLGYYHGTYTVTEDTKKGKGEYLIEREVQYRNGVVLRMNGNGTLYGGYHLRYALASAVTRRIEGVFDLDAPSGTFTGKWWSVVQDANSFGNERLAKMGGSPIVLAAFPQSFKIAAGPAQDLELIGGNLPTGIKEADIQFSDPNVKIKKIEKIDGPRLLCKLEVGPNASPGVAKISVKGVSSDAAVTVYSKMDGIKVFPAIGRARVSSGPAYPPQGVQFVARGVSNGKDGKPDTDDDLMLEPLDAKWTLEEEKTRDNDDDLKYLDEPVPNGLYTPFTTYAPIESREQRREGVGLIAIVASYDEGGNAFKGRSLLVVTEPDFITNIK